MSLKNIREKIESDAAKEAKKILRAANTEKEESLRKAGARLEDQQAKDIKKLGHEMEDFKKRLENHARRESEKNLQNARRTIIDAAITKAVEKLASVKNDEYIPLIRSILSRCCEEGRIEVMISPTDEKRITPAFLKECSSGGREYVLSDKRHGETGGIILVSGRISINATFSMMADLAHEQMVMQLSPLLPLP